MDIDDLTVAVSDNIKAQGEQFAAAAAEDANIEAAITKLTAIAGSNPAVQAQIKLIQDATTAQRTANTAAIAENTKLAAALGVVVPVP